MVWQLFAALHAPTFLYICALLCACVTGLITKRRTPPEAWSRLDACIKAEPGASGAAADQQADQQTELEAVPAAAHRAAKQPLGKRVISCLEDIANAFTKRMARRGG